TATPSAASRNAPRAGSLTQPLRVHTARKLTRLATQIQGPQATAQGWRSTGGLNRTSCTAIDPIASGHHSIRARRRPAVEPTRSAPMTDARTTGKRRPNTPYRSGPVIGRAATQSESHQAQDRQAEADVAGRHGESSALPVAS